MLGLSAQVKPFCFQAYYTVRTIDMLKDMDEALMLGCHRSGLVRGNKGKRLLNAGFWQSAELSFCSFGSSTLKSGVNAAIPYHICKHAGVAHLLLLRKVGL